MLRRPVPWYAAFGLWFGFLWWMSSGVPEFPEPLRFKASDKLLHFGYFFGGAGLLSAALSLSHPGWSTRRRVFIVTLIVASAGALDEFHQSFVPGRSGNDPFDLAADILGAFAGSLAFLPFRRLFKAASPSPLPEA